VEGISEALISLDSRIMDIILQTTFFLYLEYLLHSVYLTLHREEESKAKSSVTRKAL
jgi:hypothetical protein